MKPKISIITVVYNGVQEIEATIKSVIFQNYPNIEYIVIDGGSNDGTMDIIKKYSSNIDYWVSEKDGGIYYAMNKGIEKATGEWIHFRNCGDYFVSEDSICELFAENIPDDIDIVHGDCYHVDNSGYTIGHPDILTCSYKKKMPFLHPSTFVRASLQKNRPFNTIYRSSADYDFFYKVLTKGHKHLYRPIIVSYFAEGGFSTNWERALIEDRKLQGRYGNIIERLGTKLYIYKKKVRDYIHDLILDNCPYIRKQVLAKRQNNPTTKKYPLPVPLSFKENILK